jgi:4-amino-4-deoxy-L-arabinose transferase-like glycosyltransferase
MTRDAERGDAARRAATLLVAAAAIVVGLVALAAVGRFSAQLNQAWTRWPDVVGLRHLALMAGYVGVVALSVAVVRRASSRTVLHWSLWGPLVLLVAVRLVLIPLVPTPLPGDAEPRFLHELALRALDGGNWLVAHRPMGFSSLLAALYAVFGARPWLAEVLNLTLAVVGGVALYRLVLAGWGRRTAAIALLLYALVPSQILLVTTVLTEAVYTGFLLAALALGEAAIRGSRVAIAVAAGAMLAVSQYVRSMSQAFVAAFALVAFLSGLAPRRSVMVAGSIVIAFVVVLAPIALHNWTSHGAVSLSTSSYGGWSVFVGANQEHDGRFNRDDQAVLRAMEQGSVWERSEILGRAGLERIASDPVGYLHLWVRKFSVMWADDAYGVAAAFVEEPIPPPIRATLGLLSQGTYAFVTVLAALGLWRARRDPPVAALLVGALIVIVALAHLVVEVQPRYHAYVVPLLCALAAPVLAARRTPAVHG